MTTILRNPATAGLLSYSRREEQDDGKTPWSGRSSRVRTASRCDGQWRTRRWRETWRAVVALLELPAASLSQGVRTQLLGGLMRCRCGNPVTGTVNAISGKHVYRCNPADERRPGGPALPADDRAGQRLVSNR